MKTIKENFWIAVIAVIAIGLITLLTACILRGGYEAIASVAGLAIFFLCSFIRWADTLIDQLKSKNASVDLQNTHMFKTPIQITMDRAVAEFVFAALAICALISIVISSIYLHCF